MNKMLPLCFCLITAAASAEQVLLDLKKTDCIRLSEAFPDYVPGVSVTGRAVVSADLDNKNSLFLRDLNDMSFPVYLDLKRDFPFWNSETVMGSIPLSRVEIQDGKVFVNGFLVSENGEKSLKKACKNVFETENIDKNSLTPVQ